MSLAQLLENRFRGDIRFRGQAYLQAERVSVTRVTADDLHAVVRDGVEYHTHLSRQNGELKMFCTCVGEGQTRDPACKHLWGTVLAVDAGSYLTGTPRPGAIPPFASETNYQPLNLRLDDDELYGEEAYEPASTSSRATATKAAPAKRKLRDWEARLLEMRTQMPGASTGAKSAEQRDREIFFEVDIDESRQAKQLVIQTSQRQRRSNGQWGKLKPLKLRPGQLDDIDLAEDRQILAFLAGGTPERSGWMAQQAEFATSVYRYRVPHELCTLILPLMSKTGRLRFLSEAETDFELLAWDEGPSWHLCLCVTKNPDTLTWELHGEVRRDQVRLPLDKCDLLLPGGLIFCNGKIALLNDFDAFDWLSAVTGEHKFGVPAGEERDLVDMLLDMPALPELDLPEELKLEEVKPVPVPVITLKTPQNRGWRQERIQGKVEFNYDGTVVPAAHVQWAIVQREQGRCLLRDQELEAASWARLQQLGFRRLVDHRQAVCDVDIPITELARAVRDLVGQNWEVRADGKQVRQLGALKFNVKSGIDWFELSADIDFNGSKASFPELLSALSRGEQTIRLDDGSLGILPEEWLQQYGLLTGLGTVEGQGLKFSTSQLGLIDALLSGEENVEVDDRYLEVRSKLQNFAGVHEAIEPDGFQGELRPYQRQGLGWLRFLEEFGFGGCLADDMGLGKTIQMLALLQHRKREVPPGERRPTLIVVPKSLLFNWVNEITRFTPELRHVEYTGAERTELKAQLKDQDIILTTYGTMRRDIMDLKELSFDYVVLDEAQTIKNATSQAAKSSRLLNARHRIALSGTPIENHLGDLWSIFEFLNPGMLGRSSLFKMQNVDGKEERSRKLIASGVRPFVLRRTKQQVAKDLPEKMEDTIICSMGRRQRELYNELREYYRDSLLGMVKKQGINKTRMHVLEALLRLRQAACHPALLDRESAEEPFAKLDILIPHLEELIEENHKSLVFSQFTSMLAIVKKHLDAKGIKYAYLDGQTRKRKQVVEEFQNDPDIKIFLISLKAGGLGLNLTSAEYVFLLDPWWNPAVEAQAIDRAHRVGQTQRVFAYRLICKDTVEEKILALQQKKRELADAILEADGGPLKDLTAEDLELLLS